MPPSVPKLALACLCLGFAAGVPRAGGAAQAGEPELKRAEQELEAKLEEVKRKMAVHAAERGGASSEQVCLRCDRALDLRTDGCSLSPPARDAASHRARELFRPACDRHQRCYATPGQTQLACDLRFHHDLLQLCGRLPSADAFKLACGATADSWFAGVRGLGGGRIVARNYQADQARARQARCEARRSARCPAGFLDLDTGR